MLGLLQLYPKFTKNQQLFKINFIVFLYYVNHKIYPPSLCNMKFR